jgi:hypothetical protein
MVRITNYAAAKIYQIECLVTNKIYIGSTCQPTIRHRLKQHVADYKKYRNGKPNYVSSYDVLEKGEYMISLIEKFPCECKDELSTREGELIKLAWNDNSHQCVNMRQPGRTQRDYRNDNAATIREYKKQYRNDNAATIREYKKQYYADNAVEILSNSKTKKTILCPCGGHYKGRQARHEKSEMHSDYVKSQLIK